jgi:hypothetical protein
MLMPHSRVRRKGEQGQTLILALAFVAFFGLVTVAILRVAEVTGLQHVQTETAAVTRASAEGGAAYAAADATRTDLPLNCVGGSTGQVTMQSGDSANYTVNTCNPGQTASSGPGSGSNCVLCVLNLRPSPTTATTTVVSASCAQCTTDLTATGGDIYVNGSIASGSTLAATSTGAHIWVLSGASHQASCCVPAATSYSSAIVDPLASLAAPSPAVTGQPAGCPSFSTANGCADSYSKGTVTLHAGLWSSLQISGKADVTLAPGVYVFTGPLSLSGQANLTATGVTLFLTCPGYGPTGTLCSSSGHTGASVSLGGQGSANIAAPGSVQYTAANVSVLADPNLIDPSGASGCTTGGNCVFSGSGQGGGISGTVDLRSGGMSLQGNGSASITGRLIVNSLNMSISGNVGSGLSLTGSGFSASACGVFDVAVKGTTAGTASPTGRAVVQSQCGGSGSLSGVVDFNYKP